MSPESESRSERLAGIRARVDGGHPFDLRVFWGNVREDLVFLLAERDRHFMALAQIDYLAGTPNDTRETINEILHEALNP